MLVNANTSPAPAMWQGLMFIGLAIYFVWLTHPKEKGKTNTPCHIFLALWTVASSVLVAKMF